MRKIAGYLTKNRRGKDQKIAQSTHENGYIKPRKTFWRNSKQLLISGKFLAITSSIILEKRAKCNLDPRRTLCTSARRILDPRRAFCNTCKVRADPSADTLHDCETRFRPSPRTLQHLQSLRRPLGGHFARFPRWETSSKQ